MGLRHLALESSVGVGASEQKRKRHSVAVALAQVERKRKRPELRSSLLRRKCISGWPRWAVPESNATPRHARVVKCWCCWCC